MIELIFIKIALVFWERDAVKVWFKNPKKGELVVSFQLLI